jgi:hypothetical protein
MQGKLAFRTSSSRRLAFAFGVLAALLLSGSAGYWVRGEAPTIGVETPASTAASAASTPYAGCAQSDCTIGGA